MGKTFKDRRKFDRKHDKNDGLKAPKKDAKKRQLPVEEEFDEYDEYEEEY